MARPWAEAAVCSLTAASLAVMDGIFLTRCVFEDSPRVQHNYEGAFMPLILTAGPAAEPISLEDAKLHARVDGDSEDLLIGSLLLAARLHIERSLDLALISQSWSLYLDHWPGASFVELPLAPLITVDAIRLYSNTGSSVSIAPGLYVIDAASHRPRIARKDGQGWPVPGRTINGIEIAFTSGYGATADDVPMPIRQAIKMLVAHWYEVRSPVNIGSIATRVPDTVSDLLMPYRIQRL
jgi:uncharacterized phiE125 gp8 family phage protein